MPKYARIINSVVAETFVPPEGVKIAECFHPDVAAQFARVPDEVEAGWTVGVDGFLPPPKPAPSMEPADDAA